MLVSTSLALSLALLSDEVCGFQDYYRAIQSYTTWDEVIDEIYETVESVEPWLTGNARGPSTAFCCLHKLISLKLTGRQIRDTTSHRDSPYIRAVRCSLSSSPLSLACKLRAGTGPLSAPFNKVISMLSSAGSSWPMQDDAGYS